MQNNFKFKRLELDNLSFQGQKLRTNRNAIHPYPAMLHPLLVDFLIDEYAKKQDVIFDPFSGSGVTLLQASLKGYKAIGIDINSLALLISKVKTTKYDIKLLLKDLNQFEVDLNNNISVDIPTIKNIDYWYDKSVLNELGKIRYILKNNDYFYKDLFLICFAFMCRDQSFTRKGEFKRYRLEIKKINELIKLNKINNDIANKVLNCIKKSIDIIQNTLNPTGHVEHHLNNSEKPFNNNLKYDLVISSPPYGDSRTTVSYGEYSSFGLEWINDLNSFGKINYKIDNESIGKKDIINDKIYNSLILVDTINKIKEIDNKRANDVLYFFNGYYNVLKNIVDNLNIGGTICFIVGNRKVKGIEIKLDQITAEFFEYFGLKFENIFVRNILNKVMPSRNSPTNKKGAIASTMTKEYIIIFRKVK
ncbi:MAG: DNA methyltransferase [Rickettsiales bacterium]|nr:DNA methyltransferase [Rickettsiales bacterium]